MNKTMNTAQYNTYELATKIGVAETALMALKTGKTITTNKAQYKKFGPNDFRVVSA